MKQYQQLVREILEKGEEKSDRTGTGTISVFGMQEKYDLREGFPLVTTKKVSIDAVIRELLWFLRGSTNINDDLTQHTPIWNPWADKNGELGPIYGYQWRKWEKFEPVEEGLAQDKGLKTSNNEDLAQQPKNNLRLYQKTHIDQIQNALNLIKNNPNSRRIIINAWNVADIDRMALPPCHTMFQFYVINTRLDCQLYQRSADIALGVPYNIASYAALLIMFAQECNLTPGIFTHTIGDAHIYLNHIEGMKKQLARKPYPLPKLTVTRKPFWDIRFEDFSLTGYKHHPFIKFPIAV